MRRGLCARSFLPQENLCRAGRERTSLSRPLFFYLLDACGPMPLCRRVRANGRHLCVSQSSNALALVGDFCGASTLSQSSSRRALVGGFVRSYRCKAPARLSLVGGLDKDAKLQRVGRRRGLQFLYLQPCGAVRSRTRRQMRTAKLQRVSLVGGLKVAKLQRVGRRRAMPIFVFCIVAERLDSVCRKAPARPVGRRPGRPQSSSALVGGRP